MTTSLPADSASAPSTDVDRENPESPGPTGDLIEAIRSAASTSCSLEPDVDRPDVTSLLGDDGQTWFRVVTPVDLAAPKDPFGSNKVELMATPLDRSDAGPSPHPFVLAGEHWPPLTLALQSEALDTLLAVTDDQRLPAGTVVFGVAIGSKDVAVVTDCDGHWDDALRRSVGTDPSRIRHLIGPMGDR